MMHTQKVGESTMSVQTLPARKILGMTQTHEKLFDRSPGD
jgi:hypothetical protein